FGLFFFSSRRRHTSFSRDWSSDVCSSDLHQADNGQIPKYVDPSGRESDFWYLGCIDATLWWLIALRFYSRHARDPSLELLVQPNVERALTWLRCQEHPRLYLLQQNEASDWADIMPRSGFVLYSNALWYC